VPKRMPPPGDQWENLAGDLEYKDTIYERINETVLKLTHRRIGRQHSKELFELVIEMIFAQAFKSGYFRFPLGFGAFKVREFKGAKKAKLMPTRPDLPVAPIAKPKNRLHLRYTEGAEVRKAMGNPGQYARKTRRRSRLDPKVLTLDLPA
jgi:nucleoid DNA-binding protein